jgi:hypothetical protein
MGAEPLTNNGAERSVQLYGWDARTENWSGPTELGSAAHGSKRLLEALRTMPGRSWYGPLNCCSPGEPTARFFTIVHDLRDCAVAMVYCNDSKTGPAEVLVVIPAELRSNLRRDFAFEFLAFAGFLGAVSESAAMTVHDRITTAIEESLASDSLVFSIGTGLWESDRDHILSQCIETIIVSLLQWISERCGQPSTPAIPQQCFTA